MEAFGSYVLTDFACRISCHTNDLRVYSITLVLRSYFIEMKYITDSTAKVKELCHNSIVAFCFHTFLY